MPKAVKVPEVPDDLLMISEAVAEGYAARTTIALAAKNGRLHAVRAHEGTTKGGHAAYLIPRSELERVFGNRRRKTSIDSYNKLLVAVADNAADLNDDQAEMVIALLNDVRRQKKAQEKENKSL